MNDTTQASEILLELQSKNKYLRSETYAGDVPRSLAEAAHRGTSFVPDRRADGEVSAYASSMVTAYASLRKEATKGGTLEQLDEAFEEFRGRYRHYTRAYLSSRTHFVSSFVAGPSKYPAARMQRRHQNIERRLDELLEFKDRALKAIRLKLRPDLALIKSSDAEAVDRLRVKIAQAEKKQEQMKAANAVIRQRAKQGHAAQVFALCALGYLVQQAEQLLAPRYGIVGQVGFPSYALSNNNANIRRMVKRVAEIEALRAKPTEEEEGHGGVRVEALPQQDRVRVFFPGRPGQGVIDDLKRNGFRWTPSLGCWQGYYNRLDQGRRIAGLTEQKGV